MEKRTIYKINLINSIYDNYNITNNYNMTKKFIFIPVVNNFHLLEKAINSVPDNLFDDYFQSYISICKIQHNLYVMTFVQ